MSTTARFWASQFLDDEGNPYSGVKVYHYTSGTTSDLDVYRDKGKTTTETQPVLGDSQGVVWFYGDGNYRLRIVSSNDILLYDWEDVQITGTRSGTPKCIVFYGSDGEQTEDAQFLFDSANNRLGVGTATNITERIVMPNNSFLGGERSTASSTEGAKRIIGINSSDQVSLDPDALGILINALTAGGLLRLDSSKLVASSLSTANGQIPIGDASGGFGWVVPTGSSGVTVTAGSQTLALSGRLRGFAKTIADFSKTSNTSLSDVSPLTFTVGSNETWVFNLGLLTDGVGGGIKIAWSGPTGITGTHGLVGLQDPGAGGDTPSVGSAVSLQAATDLTTTISTGTSAVGETFFVIVHGFVTTTLGGTMQLQAAQSASSATASRIMTGSWLEYYKCLPTT